MKQFFLVAMMLVFSLVSGAKQYPFVVLETTMGKMKIKLYEDTPLHSENFIRLVEKGHYNGLLFHRVIKDFMIQSGSSDSRNAEKGKILGAGGPEERVAAEFRSNHLHTKGALSAARQGDQVNPKKLSSGEQFYIVQGKTYTDEELDMVEVNKVNKAKNEMGRKLFMEKQEEYKLYAARRDKAKADSLLNTIQQTIDGSFTDYTPYTIPESVRELYKTVGGAPFLDGEYTVYGEVIEGFDIIDKIADQPVDRNNRPEEDIKIIKAYTTKR
ncbi:peptidylprolyl isomerase [Porphyromonadaceae bacterium OttesenSCG-928-L07]|nr:peptidylprolyl isomerase [Porphyromonadaceae bacterium OttesenSCG-928-L07]MDL2330786.1 peptidylprolyl isomerase [Odoribacter sp. OttesenSCG-928-A06]